MIACLIDGCIVPPSEVWRVFLSATAVGIGGGICLSTVLSKALDLALMVVERRHRIEAARTRDHSQVPSIHG